MSISETITENIFRDFYKAGTFDEKSAISEYYGFVSKKKTGNKGYPDFFLDTPDYAIVVEAKAINHLQAEQEVQFYMNNNKICKPIIGMAISGQHLNQIKVTYFCKFENSNEIVKFKVKDKLLNLADLKLKFIKLRNGETITDEKLIKTLKMLNEMFNKGNKVRDTDRSLFFSGIMIALTYNTFQTTYKFIQQPTNAEVKNSRTKLLESHHMNRAILDAISIQLNEKINNLSKEFNWKDRFSFIKNIDYSLQEYKQLIELIEKKIYIPCSNDEKQDILGKAYKIFLSRVGGAENKNIILTPDHIKSLMIKLARLNVNDVVLDTCTGTGGFLMEAMETLINLAEENSDKINEIKEKQLIGFEKDEILFALACSNMFLHGDGRSNMLFRSSLLDDNSAIVNSSNTEMLNYIQSLKVTKCIINPPYEKNQSILFLKQALEYMQPNGKLIIIMPTPTLHKNRNGLTEEILSMAKLEYMIKMPLNLFSEQKRIVNTSIFGFSKEPHKPTDKVMFYNLKDDGFVSIQHKGRVDKNNSWNNIENTILTTINNRETIPNICTMKPIFKDNEINCYGFNTDLNENLISMGELFNFEKGKLASSDEIETGEYDFITADDCWKKASYYTHYNIEALIYVTHASGSLGKVHYANGTFIASNLCYVLTPKEQYKDKINMRFYSYYLNAMRETIATNLADGTSKLTIDINGLKQYPIELIDISKQNDIENTYISKFEELLSSVKSKKMELNKLLSSMI